ncbi:hypothetical protein Rsub_03110 [Raphidocelis subcapitata]|uniref:COX assembly mitochondrial protein n=1 Tax=Raphidocelis subcapitata TaxID=307507 RepID=A0A2V0NU13_9CHLO|nr:hypothetical protein Rsub_03110 [Raphidocelis subcapitata]|eukprot:GBF90809.1 hypothetical protein Rsub_03110 [Raphidocelis subcapitata]
MPRDRPPEERISRQAEDKLAHKLALVAQVKCKGALDAYNDCCRGRMVSMVWACKRLYQESDACIQRYVNEDNVGVMRRRWLEAGKPNKPDWGALMEGLVDD